VNKMSILLQCKLAICRAEAARRALSETHFDIRRIGFGADCVRTPRFWHKLGNRKRRLLRVAERAELERDKAIVLGLPFLSEQDMQSCQSLFSRY
jgi:hypothetical protein